MLASFRPGHRRLLGDFCAPLGRHALGDDLRRRHGTSIKNGRWPRESELSISFVEIPGRFNKAFKEVVHVIYGHDCAPGSLPSAGLLILYLD
jgi:hypothetical protein